MPVKYKKINSYNLDPEIRMAIKYIVRGHKKRKLKLQEMVILSSPEFDGMPHGTGISNPVERQALKEMSLTELINAVDKALQEVPEKFRKGVWNHVELKTAFPADYSRQTYTKWQKIFLYRIAENLYWV